MTKIEILDKLNKGVISVEYATLLLKEIDAEIQEGIELTFSSDEAYVVDHLVQGRSVLLGVTYISYIQEIIRRDFPNVEVINIKNFTFHSPVLFDKQSSVTIKSTINREKDKLDIQVLFSQGKNDDTSIAASCVCFIDVKDELKYLDVSSLKSSRAKKMILDEVYAKDSISQIHHGLTFRTIDSLTLIDNEAFGEVTLKAIASQMKDWILQPALIEAAVMSGLCLLPESQLEPYVPIAIKNIVLHNVRLSDNCKCHATIKKNINGILELDLKIANEDNAILLSIDGFTGKSLLGRKPVDDVSKGNKVLVEEQVLVSDEKLDVLIKRYIVKKINVIEPKGSIKENSPKNFMDMGIDSMQLLSLSKQIEEEVGIELYPTIFFEYQNISELTGYFLREHEVAFRSFLINETPLNQNVVDRKIGDSFGEVVPEIKIVESNIFVSPSNDNVSVNYSEDDIAIIGMTGLFPKSENFDDFWERIIQKDDLMEKIPQDHFDYAPWFDERMQRPDKMYCANGSFIDNVSSFDAAFFNISSSEAETMDPQLRKLLQVVYNTCEDAGYIDKIKGTNTGMYVGACFHDYCFEILRSRKRVGPYDGIGNAATMLSNYPSFIFDLKGPSLTVDTACSSSSVALHLACNAIKNGECEMAFASGVNLLLSPWHYLYFCSTGVLSKSGRCHTFDSRADGYVPGEAIVSLLLKPLSKAKADGDHIHAIVKGSSINHGGYTPTISAPSVRMEADVMINAWKAAKIDVGQLGLIECHGTGTQLGDPIEINAIKTAFSSFNVPAKNCAVSSIKSNIGHTEGAAGLAGIVRVILSMKKGIIPAMPKFDTINPFIKLDNSPIYINTEHEEWKRINNKPRLAGVNSFGFGGAYAHVVIEEYVQREIENRIEKRPCVFMISARNKSTLHAYASRLLKYFILNSHEAEKSFENISYTLFDGRKAWEERLAIVAESTNELISSLQKYINDEADDRSFVNTVSIDELTDSDISKFAQTIPDFLEIAKEWTLGKNVDIKSLFRNKNQIVSLPTYPFEGGKYFLNFKSNNLSPLLLDENDQQTQPHVNLEVGKPRLSPILHNFVAKENYTSFFNSSFLGSEQYIADHLVHGQKVLVGAALIEMVYSALKQIYNVENVIIKNIRWISPVIFENDPKLLVLKYDERNNTVEIKSEGAKKTDHFFCSVRIPTENPVQLNTIDFDAVKQRTINYEDGNKVYDKFKKLGLNLGASFHSLIKVYYNENEALSFVKIPDSLRNEVNEFSLHPTLLDGVFHILSVFFDNESFINVPFSIGEIEIFKKLSERVIVYATKNTNNQGKGFNSFNLTVVSSSNEVLLNIKDFVAKEINPDKIGITPKPHFEVENVEEISVTSEWVETGYNNIDNSRDIDHGAILLFDADSEFYTAMKTSSAYKNVDVVLVTPMNNFKKLSRDHFEIDFLESKDYLKLFDELKGDGIKIKSIIHFCSKSNFDFTEVNLLHQLNESCYPIFTLSKAIAGRFRENIKLFYFYKFGDKTEPVYSATGSMLKSVESENGKISYYSIGYKDNTNASVLINYLSNYNQIESREVRLAENKFFHREYSEINLKEIDNPDLFKNRGVYIISGGLGKVGIIIAEYLAKKYHAKLVLVGRSNDTSDKLHLLNGYGAESIFIKGDVGVKSDVDNVIAIAKQKFGSINGIIHCAGFIKDASILKKNLSDVKMVIDPKVLGAINLDLATKDEPLDLFVLVSSLSAIIGNAGQTDYAYANSFLDYYSEFRNSLLAQKLRRGFTKSINFPLWKDGGMQLDESIQKAFFDKFGLLAISNNNGLDAIVRSLQVFGNQMIYLKGLRGRINENIIEIQPKITNQMNSNKEYIDSENIRTELLKELVLITSKLIDKKDVIINGAIKLEQYGMNSIAFTEFTNQLNEKFDLDVSPGILFSNPSLDDLTQYLIQEYPNQIFKAFPSVESYRNNQKSENHVVTNHHSLSNFSENKWDDHFNVDFGDDNLSATINKREALESYQDIAIIGIDGVFPMSNDLDIYWDNIKNRRSLVSEVPADRWDWKQFMDNGADESIKWGGFVDKIDSFDSEFFGISPREADLMDPQQRLFLMMAWKTIENAGYSPLALSGKKVGVFVGCSSFDYLQSINSVGIESDAYASIGNAHSVIANRISYFLNFKGPSESIDTACSSSLVAISRAIESIQLGNSELALAGGVNLMINPFLHMSFSKAGMLSKDGKCKTFDKKADGYVRGEGGGAVLLKSLSRAKADKDFIYAVIKGHSINHGGRATSFTAPNPDAQASLIIDCYNKANINPDSIDYIEVHGTGTSLGDSVEVEGLKRAFKGLNKEHNVNRASCGISSVKSNIGHLEAAAGIASVLKGVLAIQNKTLPPTINFEQINTNLKLEDSPFYIIEKAQNWDVKNTNHLRRAGVSSFGFGGTNAHVLIEEYPNNYLDKSAGNQQFLFVYSAKNIERLTHYLQKNTEFLKNQEKEINLSNYSYTLQTGRSAFKKRIAIIASGIEDLCEKINMALNNQINDEFIFRTKDNQDDSLVSILTGSSGSEYIKSLAKDNNLKNLAQLWTLGIDIDWSEIYTNNKPQKIAIPTYPFAENVHWFVKNRDNSQQLLSLKTIVDKDASINALQDKSIEQLLKRWLSELTRIKEELINYDDNLYDMGLDSILSMELIEKINKHFKIRIYANEIVTNPTISKLAIVLRSEIGQLSPEAEIIENSSNDFSAVPLLDTTKSSNHGGVYNTKPVIYVLSSPRSGSTLLRTMMMGHSKLFAPPELFLLPFDNLKQWDEQLTARGWGHFKDGLVETFKELKGISSLEAKSYVKDLVNQEVTMGATFELLNELTNDKLLVDKTPPYAEKLEYLQRSEVLTPNAFYIYLYRHPLSVMESLVRNRFHKMLGINKDPWIFADEAWRVSNQNIIDFLDSVPQNKVMTIRYEDMVEDPTKLMKELCKRLEIDYEESMIKPYEGERMLSGVHNKSLSIGDPNFLTHNSIEAELANSWKKHLDKKHHISDKTLLVLEHLGYSLKENFDEAISLSPSQISFLANINSEYRNSMIQEYFTQSFDEKLDVERFQNCFDKVIERHSVLTNKYIKTDSGWLQQHTLLTPKVAYYDLTKFEIEQHDSEVARIVANMHNSIEPREGKTIEMAVCEIKEKTYRIILVVHVLVADGVSTGIMWKELFDFYKYPDKIAKKDNAFYEYISKLNEFKKSSNYIDHQEIWRNELDSHITKIPADFNKVPVDFRSQSIVEFSIGRDELGADSTNNGLFYNISTSLYSSFLDWTADEEIIISHRLNRRNPPISGNYNASVGRFAGDMPVLVKRNSNDINEISKEFKQKFNRLSPLATSYELMANDKLIAPVGQITEILLNFQPLPSDFNAIDWRAYGLQTPDQKLTYPIECIAREFKSEIRCLIRFSKNRYKRQTIVDFSKVWRESIIRVFANNAIGVIEEDIQNN